MDEITVSDSYTEYLVEDSYTEYPIEDVEGGAELGQFPFLTDLDLKPGIVYYFFYINSNLFW